MGKTSSLEKNNKRFSIIYEQEIETENEVTFQPADGQQGKADTVSRKGSGQRPSPASLAASRNGTASLGLREHLSLSSCEAFTLRHKDPCSQPIAAASQLLRSKNQNPTDGKSWLATRKHRRIARDSQPFKRPGQVCLYAVTRNSLQDTRRI